MCDTCGCSEEGEYKIHNLKDKKQTQANNQGGDDHYHNHNHDHSHDHDNHSHNHDHDHDHHHHDQKIKLNIDILSENNMLAKSNRRFFEGRKVICLNLVSSPGSGKTSILEKTILELSKSMEIAVVEGDQQTLLDAERIEKAGADAIQINTGSGCHLDAKMIDSAIDQLDLGPESMLFIENVGNLVCPAMFDLGETKRVVVISVTEGEDKPLKYPYMFQTSNICLINKSDLLPYVDFNVEKCMEYAKSINPLLEFILVSAKSGEGLNEWFQYLKHLK